MTRPRGPSSPSTRRIYRNTLRSTRLTPRARGSTPTRRPRTPRHSKEFITDITEKIDIARGKWAQSLEDGLLEPLKDVEAFVTAHPVIAALIGAGAGKVAYKGVKSFAKDFIGASALDASAGALTGSAAALDEAALALKGAALTRGPGGVPGRVPGGPAAPAVASAGGGLLAALTKDSERFVGWPRGVWGIRNRDRSGGCQAGGRAIQTRPARRRQEELG